MEATVGKTNQLIVYMLSDNWIHEKKFFTEDKNLRAKSLHAHLHHLLVNSGSIVASPVDTVVKRSGHLAHIQNFIHTPSFLNPHIVDLIGRHIVARVPEPKFFNPA